MKRLFVALIVVASLACSAPSTNTNIEPLVGVYTLQGTNVDGSTYGSEMLAAVTRAEDGSATIRIFQEGRLVAVGVGLRRDAAFTFVYQSWTGDIGLAILSIEGETLTGSWKQPAYEGVGSETWTKSDVPLPEQAPVEAPNDHGHEHPIAQPGHRL